MRGEKSGGGGVPCTSMIPMASSQHVRYFTYSHQLLEEGRRSYGPDRKELNIKAIASPVHQRKGYKKV